MPEKKQIRKKVNSCIKISSIAFSEAKELCSSKGTKLSQALKARNISQRELAKRLGMKATALNYACKNGVKTIRIAIRYAKALSCSWQEVLETPESEASQ